MDVLAQLDALVPAFQRAADATTIDQLDDQTPCEEWKVRDLFGHLIGGATTFAAAVRGAEPPPVPAPPDASLAATASAAVADLDAAFRGDGALERIVATPFGDMPGEVFARILAFDLLMHTWDLARATDRPAGVPEEVVAEVDAFARQAITDDMRQPGLFGAAVPEPEGAAPLDRLAAFAGRRG